MKAKPMTMTQKILADHAVGLDRPWVQAGDIILVRVDFTIASELSWNGMEQTYVKLGQPKIHDPARFFLAVDHTVDPTTLAHDQRTKRLVEKARSLARQSGIKHFYDANQTILHTKFYRDLVLPGDVVLGSDSHTTSHGGLGALAIGLGGADITAAMVLGQSWLEVPEAIAVEYQGKPQFGIGGKDIILKTLGDLKRNTVAMERTVEYRGEHVRAWSTDMRFTIANMTAELGGLNGIFEADEVVASWIRDRPGEGRKEGGRYFAADPDAPYVAVHRIDLSELGPLVAKPFSPDNVVPVEGVAGHPLAGAFIGACTTTEEELVLAALVLEVALGRGEKPVATGQRIVVPGDLSIQRNLHEAGLWSIYERAGFTVDPPGCSMCLGVASRKAGQGESWISSQNRNFPNRMGEGSLAFLASAATVAASSLGMTITDPRPFLAAVSRERLARILRRSDERPAPVVEIVEPTVKVEESRRAAKAAPESAGPRIIVGRVQRFGDQVDTDAIIPGEFCHLTSLEELGEKCFHFVRPGFAERVRAGQDVIVAGEGWGSGSSREQAVWALMGAGIRAVVAKSFAFIHKRNLVNEALAFLIVDDPEFYSLAGEGATVELDLMGSRVTVEGKTFAARGTTSMIRALQQEGGLVPAILRHGRDVFTTLASM
ncbi:MAG: 3-isopropylmalate dehydratase [Deltaproteobacteria bacterium]|nr:3-isopropylmalate dehydratase [Deltaproteobacteria bacterium]